LDRLGLLKGEWCLVGGKCLEFRGLRKSEDWDILVSPFLFESLTQKFPNHLKISKYKTPILVFDDQKIEIFKDLPFLEGHEQKIINQALEIYWEELLILIWKVQNGVGKLTLLVYV